MDPITHALTGATVIYTFPKEVRPWWFVVWGILVAMLPDIDIFFVDSAIDYIKIHRGITHSLAGAWALSFICTIPLVMLTTFRPQPNVFPPPKTISWSLIGAWIFAYGILVLHIWLDVMNSYGTQLLLPFSDYRVRLNGLFIIDLLLTLPLVLGLLFWRNNRLIMFILLLWIIIYPITSVGIRLGFESYLNTVYIPLDKLPSSQHKNSFGEGLNNVQKVYLLPDAFTPLHWKLVLDNGDYWSVAGYTIFSSPPTYFTHLKKPPERLWELLKERSTIFRTYEQFAALPTLNDVKETSRGKQYIFSDLRFGSTIPFVNELQVKREGEEVAFRIMAIINDENTLSSVRFITGLGAGGDTGWIPPSSE